MSVNRPSATAAATNPVPATSVPKVHPNRRGGAPQPVFVCHPQGMTPPSFAGETTNPSAVTSSHAPPRKGGGSGIRIRKTRQHKKSKAKRK
jgi:hypothetical protein